MSTAADTAGSTAPVAPKARPYKRYLTSALHTRFVHAVLLSLLTSLLITFGTGHDYFWSWFPLGPAGLKAILFSMTSLFVFFLQLATLRIGRETSSSAFATLRDVLFSFSTIQTIFWYIVSAWWFCEAYIWAVPDSHKMAWVLKGSSGEMDRLNERPIYLRFFFTIMALVQSALHIYYGRSFLHIPVSKVPTPQSTHQETHQILPVQKQLRDKAIMIGIRAVVASALATVITPFIYKPLFRDLFWKIHLAFAKPFFSLSRSDAHPPNTYFIGSILGWAFVIGVGLSVVWEMATVSFFAFLRQSPLKNALPLSAGSQDPNGTLLNGLIAKRSLTKTFAFWELSLISQKFPDRRIAIFADFERSNGPMWTQMSNAAISVVSEIGVRISALNPTTSQPTQAQSQGTVQSLPRITNGLSQKAIFAAAPPPSTRTQQIETFLATTNKAIGQSKTPWSPPIKETQQKLLEYSKSAVVPGGNIFRKRFDETTKTGFFSSLLRAQSGKRIAGVIIGSPAGNAAIIVDAIESITRMLVASLNEDNFGKAVYTVPETIKQFTKTVNLVENYVNANAQSLMSEDEEELAEVVIIVDRMRAALRELLSAFQVFLNDAGLGIKELNEAKRASEDQPLLPRRQYEELEYEELEYERAQMEEVGTTQKQQEQRQEKDRRKREEQRQQEDKRRARRRHDGSEEVSRQQEKQRRMQETAQSLKRIEAQPQRQSISSSNSNVFGVRDFGSGFVARNRQSETAR